MPNKLNHMVMIACIGIILASDAPAYADGTAAQDDLSI